MLLSERVTSGDGAGPGGEPEAAGRDRSARWRGVRQEAGLALELAALTAFAFSRPVLDSFGRSPETFVARGADAPAIVQFGVVVALGPALAFALVGLASRILGTTGRRWAHLVLVGGLGGLAAWRLGQDLTGWPPGTMRLIVAAALLGVVVALVRAVVPLAGTFLRYTGVASLIFLGQFLFLSPVSSLVRGDGPRLDDEVAAGVAAELGSDAPTVVVVVFDALPTASLLDGTGRIDGEQFPNFGRLAATSTWYRNNTTVAAFTGQAVPAILTGRLPDSTQPGYVVPDPENLFTWLGGAYDPQVRELSTRLCPDELCGNTGSPGLGVLLGDAATLWGEPAPAASGDVELPGVLEEERYAEAERWIGELDTSPEGRPDLVFYHTMLPHGPWTFSADGSLYRAAWVPTGTFAFAWTETGIPVGRQRHLLQTQAADRLLGQLLDGLEATGVLDEALVVVTADHGEAFLPNEPPRFLSAANLGEIAWTPLFVKAPGQTGAAIDDSNTWSIDIVPTIADVLGVDLPWEVDGVPAAQAGRERGDEKRMIDSKGNPLRPEEGEIFIEIDAETARAAFEDVLGADALPATGPDAIWRRTEHGDLFGREIADLTVGDEAAATVTVDQLGDLQEQGTEETPLLEIVGRTGLPEGEVVAYALGGTVAALTVVEPPAGDQPNTALALVPPHLLAIGHNQLTAYLVEGPVGAEVLHPLAVEPG